MVTVLQTEGRSGVFSSSLYSVSLSELSLLSWWTRCELWTGGLESWKLVGGLGFPAWAAVWKLGEGLACPAWVVQPRQLVGNLWRDWVVRPGRRLLDGVELNSPVVIHWVMRDCFGEAIRVGRGQVPLCLYDDRNDDKVRCLNQNISAGKYNVYSGHFVYFSSFLNWWRLVSFFWDYSECYAFLWSFALHTACEGVQCF